MLGKPRIIAVQLFAVAILFLLSAAGVKAQQVSFNFMPGTDFSKYHTFKWVDIPSNVHPNQIISQEIRDAVNNALQAKGFTLTTGDKADLYVGYQCSVDQERQWNAWGMGGGLRWGGGMASAQSSTITNGMLGVDFYDPSSQQLIWRGTAAQTLNPSGNQQKDLDRLNKAVAKLLKNFPPQAKKSGW
ncbi:MAG TPA: DUF4136 domain-containing protein [Candidatus Acidoferrum sp.]|nr:DUF4136 domain-containing protein [Candidatus Acidoferrum sp.]